MSAIGLIDSRTGFFSSLVFVEKKIELFCFVLIIDVMLLCYVMLCYYVKLIKYFKLNHQQNKLGQQINQKE